jgi:threonine/homoserine/homoserine lactone efflux protein
MLKFVAAVLLVELTPGPNMGYLATLSITRGRMAGLLAVAGVALGLSVHAVITSLGAGELLLRYPWLYEIIRWIGIAYFFFLALESWRHGVDSPDSADLKSTSGLLLRGFLSNVFNPKSVLFFISVVPTFVGLEPGHPDFLTWTIVFGLVDVAIATTIHVAIVMLAAQFRTRLIEHSRKGLVQRIFAVALALMAVWLIFATGR